MKLKTNFLFFTFISISLASLSIHETGDTKNITDGQKLIECPVFTKSSSSDQTIQLVNQKVRNKYSEKIVQNWAHWSCSKTQLLEDNYQLFCYKIDQSWTERRPDGYDVSYHNGRPVATPKYRHILNPVYFYTNDYNFLKADQILKIKQEGLKKTATAGFGGAIIGAITALCAHSLLSHQLSYNLKPGNVVAAAVPAAVAFAGMVYNMFRTKTAEYQNLTEDEYLELKKAHLSADCDDFDVVCPNKNLHEDLLTYGGISAAVGLTAFMFKSLSDKMK